MWEISAEIYLYGEETPDRADCGTEPARPYTRRVQQPPLQVVPAAARRRDALRQDLLRVQLECIYRYIRTRRVSVFFRSDYNRVSYRGPYIICVVLITFGRLFKYIHTVDAREADVFVDRVEL